MQQGVAAFVDDLGQIDPLVDPIVDTFRTCLVALSDGGTELIEESRICGTRGCRIGHNAEGAQTEQCMVKPAAAQLVNPDDTKKVAKDWKNGLWLGFFRSSEAG